MKEITSFSNPFVKKIKKFYKKRTRWNEKKFLIEGVKVVEECIKAKSKIDYIVFSEDLFKISRGKDLFERVNDMGCKIINVSNDIFKEISDTTNPQGIMALVNFNLVNIEQIIKRKNRFIIILDELQDPGNLGTIVRTADAFNSSGVILTEGCVDIYNSKVVRSTMGSIFHVPITYTNNKLETLSKLKNNEILVYSTCLDGNVFTYQADFKKDFAVVIGNEAKGVSTELKYQSDYLVKIPMPGKAESLNAAVASSIILYEAARQRM